jgi:hypothetical protein
LKTADATRETIPVNIEHIASEVDLGKPLSSMPRGSELEKILNGSNKIIEDFLKNLATQIKSGFRLSLALPAWKTRGGFRHLPLLDSLEKLGYNRVSFAHAKNEELIYYREGQIVGRELVVLTRK